MRIFRFALFLTLVVLPASLFAQGISSVGTSSSSSSSSPEVTNLSEAGGFVGGGRPDVFVGTTDFDQPSSASRTASSTSRNTRTTTATTRPRTATTAAARSRVGMTAGIASLGTSSNQTIRSATSLDSDMIISPTQRHQPVVDTYLARLHGIRDGQVSYTPSPQGTTAVLKGTAASERERRVAQQLLLLEPGINWVENLLEIR